MTGMASLVYCKLSVRRGRSRWNVWDEFVVCGVRNLERIASNDVIL